MSANSIINFITSPIKIQEINKTPSVLPYFLNLLSLFPPYPESDNFNYVLMESNGLTAGMYPNMGPRMQGLEMSLHHHLPQIPPTTQMAAATAYPHHNRDYDQQQQQQQQHQHPGLTQFPGMQDYSSFAARPKTQTFTLSDDDEQGQTVSTMEKENSADDGKRTATSSSPWQRMKWTDDMIRLLIMVVYCIGDHEVGSDDHHPSASASACGIKKKNSAVLQKKGKWKSVSMAMMHKGFSVSPQQCEDKFNDLNKRYKRVNDILGKGIACKVVEDHSLLDTIDLPPKLKDEVKKLLNSKHLFFKDMCNYHTSLGRATTGGGTSQLSPESITQQLISLQHPQPQRPLRQDDEEEDGDSDEEDDDDDEDYHPIKRQRINGGGVGDGQVQDFSNELKNVLQDETKSALEKRRWMKGKMMQLEEQHVGYESEGLELEIQRYKWLKYKKDKERELESDKLILERKKLENERMMLLIRHKDFDLVNAHQLLHQNRQSSSRTSD